MDIILADRYHPLRQVLEGTVQSVFKNNYNATVTSFPEHVVAALGAEDEVFAVAGLRSVRDGFFSEIYLDGSAEDALTRACGRRVSRDGIIEFSSLATVKQGAAMPLVGAAIGLCLAAGASHGLFTATARLRVLLRRSGLNCIDLGAADPQRLASAGDWGSYYFHEPRVIAVSADSLASFRPMTRQERLHA